MNENKNPAINIFTNFLDDRDCDFVESFCKKHKVYLDNGPWINNPPSPKIGEQILVHKQQQHSKRIDITYMKAEFDSFSGHDEQTDRKADRSVSSITHWKDWPKDENTELVVTILNKMTEKVISTIYELYSKKASIKEKDGGPWIASASSGMKMNMHTDYYPDNSINQKTEFSSIYYISDDFDGGEFYMPVMGFKFKPKKNSLLLFSDASNEDTCHEVLEVTSGTRFSSQGFFFIP